VLLYAITYKFI